MGRRPVTSPLAAPESAGHHPHGGGIGADLRTGADRRDLPRPTGPPRGRPLVAPAARSPLRGPRPLGNTAARTGRTLARAREHRRSTGRRSRCHRRGAYPAPLVACARSATGCPASRLRVACGPPSSRVFRRSVEMRSATPTRHSSTCRPSTRCPTPISYGSWRMPDRSSGRCTATRSSAACSRTPRLHRRSRPLPCPRRLASAGERQGRRRHHPRRTGDALLVPPRIGPVPSLPAVDGTLDAPDDSAADLADADASAKIRDALRLRVRWVHELTARVSWELAERLVLTCRLSRPDGIRHMRFHELRDAVRRGSHCLRPARPHPRSESATAERVPPARRRQHPRRGRGVRRHRRRWRPRRRCRLPRRRAAAGRGARRRPPQAGARGCPTEVERVDRGDGEPVEPPRDPREARHRHRRRLSERTQPTSTTETR